jgi:hypothetical protein
VGDRVPPRQTSHIYLLIEMLLKTKKQLGTKFEETFYFFSRLVSLEFKEKIRAWKYASDLARIQTLNLSKL